jgi:hypothetical protein
MFVLAAFIIPNFRRHPFERCGALERSDSCNSIHDLMCTASTKLDNMPNLALQCPSEDPVQIEGERSRWTMK